MTDLFIVVLGKFNVGNIRNIKRLMRDVKRRHQIRPGGMWSNVSAMFVSLMVWGGARAVKP